MLKYIEISAERTNDKNKIESADDLILPGVGTFDKGIKSLINQDLFDIILHKVNKGTRILGICLGMQMLFNSSEEGNQKGLGLIDGEIIKFNDLNNKIPHMGWNFIIPTRKNNYFINQNNNYDRFYFVHSFYAKCNNNDDILTMTNYGNKFVSAVKKKNIMGVQFHPEKSHRFGINFFKNYFYNIKK